MDQAKKWMIVNDFWSQEIEVEMKETVFEDIMLG